ncbi:hypothetical protein EHQ61_00045 [Leptospira wolffii]|uniref:AAA family ATPase n=1 Tax=Leptospira wolffii TaxID=409998 RepID=UPI0010834C54|nr:AAA family ATPase [Leptospira wolffii]TGL55687.1 hypothetical protein EHQ61_00045 [Leptospira wolffii]
MIKAIAKIKGLGVFQNYSKPTGTKEFGVKNLIYGWNYSGKTTLSRLFAQLESKSVNSDFLGSSFSLETDNGLVTEENFMQTTLSVRVFNSDFVRDNLNFTGQSFKPILLLGKESEEAQRKLDHCENLLQRTQEMIRRFAKESNDLESTFSSAKTAAASRIKKTLGLVEAYTAAHFANDITSISTLQGSQLLAEDKVRDDLKLALAQDSERPDIVDQIVISLSIELLYKEAVKILLETPSFTNTIKHLEENPQIEKWVDTGLLLHSEKDKCEFCGGDLSKHRLAELQAHFSQDLADHKNKVEQLLNKVKMAKLSINLPTESEFNPQFREKFRKAVAPLSQAIGMFNKAVESLLADIQKKIDAPFKAQVPKSLPEDVTQSVSAALNTINEVINENNLIASNFTAAKRDAIKRIKFHFVQEFIDDQEKVGREARVKRLKAKEGRLSRFGEEVKREADKWQAIISNAQLGREEINKRLASMLGNEPIQIKVVLEGERERFQLVRKNGEVARNLSDGERTTIAFSYFLTKLKELKTEQFKETIVYIDDPISSLDSNHIFQLTAAIKEVFFSKNSDGAWSTNCKQFFLSTHNFQFFDLIRELEPKKTTKSSLYFIRKINPTQSILGDMPVSLCKYSSEYHFLFETIYKFHKAEDKGAHEILMLLPNAVRRFVELYTYSRIPSDIDYPVDRRAETLFGAESAKRILKVLHYFSHGNSIDRLIGNNELIFDIEHAVNELLSAIQSNDSLHWDALLRAIDSN